MAAHADASTAATATTRVEVIPNSEYCTKYAQDNDGPPAPAAPVIVITVDAPTLAQQSGVEERGPRTSVMEGPRATSLIA